jgi:hypothetical protein
MILSAEKLTTWELCPRRYIWTNRYATRISLMGALYRALDAGLKASKNPEQASRDEYLALAARPGLDLVGGDVYAIATHYAHLAGVIAEALRNAFPDPWRDFPDVEVGNDTIGRFQWRSGLYDAGNGIQRRLVLADRWSDDRKATELRGWRMVGELVAIRQPIALTAIEIGSSREKRRISPWTRCYRHPRNDVYRFRRQNSEEDFSRTWKAQWREDSGIGTAEWLTRMQKDGCMDAVQTVNVPVPARPSDFLNRACQIAGEMQRWEERIGEHPPMRLAGCHDVVHGPCPFLTVCHGASAPIPEKHGFRERIQSAAPPSPTCTASSSLAPGVPQ